MIIINLSGSGYMIEINGKQVSVVGLNTKIQEGKKTTHLNHTQHGRFCGSSNQNVQWLNIMMENLGLIKDKKIEKYSYEKQEDQETKCCFHAVLLYFALEDASYFHVLNPHLFLSFSSFIPLWIDFSIPAKGVQLSPQINKDTLSSHILSLKLSER